MLVRLLIDESAHSLALDYKIVSLKGMEDTDPEDYGDNLSIVQRRKLYRPKEEKRRAEYA